MHALLTIQTALAKGGQARSEPTIGETEKGLHAEPDGEFAEFLEQFAEQDEDQPVSLSAASNRLLAALEQELEATGESAEDDAEETGETWLRLFEAIVGEDGAKETGDDASDPLRAALAKLPNPHELGDDASMQDLLDGMHAQANALLTLVQSLDAKTLSEYGDKADLEAALQAHTELLTQIMDGLDEELAAQQVVTDVEQWMLQLQKKPDTDSDVSAEDLAGLAAAAELDEDGEASTTTEQMQALQQLLQDIEQHLAGSDDDLLTFDINSMAKELTALLDKLEAQQGAAVDADAKADQLALLVEQLAELSQQVDALQSEDPEAQQEAMQLNQLLTQANELLRSLSSDSRLTVQQTGGNNLPPAAQALALVSQQVREQLAQSSTAADSTSDTEADAEDGASAFEQIRRLLSDSQAASGSDNRAQSTSSNGSPNGTLSTAQNNGATMRENQTLTRQAETQQSNVEQARQTQQAIDILGPQAPERLRERVSVMFNSRTQAAEMRLDPPDLGRLNIRLSVSQEQASVSFQVTTPQAREAIEQSLSRLRELLQEQGIELADANVSEEQQQAPEQQQGFAEERGEQQGFMEEGDLDQQPIEIASPVSDGRVDYYA